MNHPLASFPIASTNDVDKAQSILSRELVDLRIIKVEDRSAFHLEMSGARLGRTMIAYNQFDTETLVNPGELEKAVLLIIGVGPRATFQIDGEATVCNGTGGILSPSRRVTIQRPAGSGTFIFKADIDAIEQQLQVVLDRHSGKPIVFDRSVDLASGVGVQANRLLDSLIDNIQQDSTVVAHPLLRAGFDEILLNTLLALPNNYSDELSGDHRRTIAPALVRKSEEFLEAHANESVTISDLLAQVDCSRAALFGAFRRYRDYTPMQFLVELRLKSAHEALQSPSPASTVTSIAYDCGFSHPGRFSTAYRKRFGENPLETLRKAEFTIDT